MISKSLKTLRIFIEAAYIIQSHVYKTSRKAVYALPVKSDFSAQSRFYFFALFSQPLYDEISLFPKTGLGNLSGAYTWNPHPAGYPPFSF
jgi:hypothetical protein